MDLTAGGGPWSICSGVVEGRGEPDEMGGSTIPRRFTRMIIKLKSTMKSAEFYCEPPSMTYAKFSEQVVLRYVKINAFQYVKLTIRSICDMRFCAILRTYASNARRYYKYALLNCTIRTIRKWNNVSLETVFRIRGFSEGEFIPLQL